MRSAGEADSELRAVEDDSGLALDEEPIDLGRVTVFKTPQLAGQEAIEGVSDHGHDHIEVHLDQDGGRQGIQVEELDGLGDHILHPPAPGVVADQHLHRGVKVIGDQEGGLFAAVAAQNHLTQLTLVVGQRDGRFMYDRMGVFALGMGDMDACPGRKRLDAIHHAFTPPAQRDEADPLLVELGEVGITGELGVKNESGFQSALEFFPKGQKAQDLLVGFIALNIGSRVDDELGGGILGKKRQCPLHGLVAGAGPVVLQNRLFSEVRDGVKVQIDQIRVIEPKPGRLVDKALLQTQQVNCVQAVGIGGHRRALGQYV